MDRKIEGNRRAWLLPLLAVTVNQLAYYGGNWIARNRPHYHLELPIDQYFPFLPWTVSIYFGSYLFWAVVYLYMARQETKLAYRFFRADLFAKLICFLCFVCFPTTNARPEVVGSSLWDDLMRLLYRLDAPTNLFPSIHCMVSWLCFIGLRAKPKSTPTLRVAVITACGMALAVCWSTLTTRQHVIVDVFAGVLLAELAWRAAGRWHILLVA